MTASAPPLLPAPRRSRYDAWRRRVLDDATLLGRWEWLTPVLVTMLAAVLRLWNLGHPHTLVFDETYYVKDAWSQWMLGLGLALQRLARLQGTRLQLGLLGLGTGQRLGLLRLLQHFGGDGLLHGQHAAALQLALRLLPLALGLLRGQHGLGPGGVAQLLQRGAGLLHLGLQIVGAQHRQHIAGAHAVAFTHAPLQHHGGEGAAHLGARGGGDAPRGHHGLHQGLCGHLVGIQPGAGHFLCADPASRGQH